MGETPILQRIVTTVIVPFLSNIDWEYSHTLIEDTRAFQSISTHLHIS